MKKIILVVFIVLISGIDLFPQAFTPPPSIYFGNNDKDRKEEFFPFDVLFEAIKNKRQKKDNFSFDGFVSWLKEKPRTAEEIDAYVSSPQRPDQKDVYHRRNSLPQVQLNHSRPLIKKEPQNTQHNHNSIALSEEEDMMIQVFGVFLLIIVGLVIGFICLVFKIKYWRYEKNGYPYTKEECLKQFGVHKDKIWNSDYCRRCGTFTGYGGGI
jgi:hypothetical protein